MGSVETVAASGGGIWELYRDERGCAVVKIEIHSAGRSAHEKAMILAELKRLMRAAAAGALEPDNELKRIERNRMIYELRLDVGGDGIVPRQLWRLYFGWHSNQGPLRLALKFARKPADASGKAAQDAHIDEAGQRYKSWLARRQTS